MIVLLFVAIVIGLGVVIGAGFLIYKNVNNPDKIEYVNETNKD